ncbi:MAG: GAF domain-containing protein [Terriglobales bacterium]|jgi:GAF domain-containing protein/Sel1 repeat-containing protein/PilZ domain-containing protein
MDQSILRLPDPGAAPPRGERRRRVRQKLCTPVYASFNGPQTGMVVDLSELLDLHEEGFAVQTSERLEMNRAVTLCLDFPETKSYIHGSGQVIWSDDAGRGGIRFSGLPESSRQILKEWLFANLLIACSNHAARTEQRARREEEKSPEPVLVTKAGSVVPIAEQSGTLSSVESVEAVGREVREIGDNIDAVLQLITERALSLTGACGAALALLTDDKMICRARAGEPAPPLGAPVDVKQGLSGECVRSGLLVSCEDLGNDARVDPEIGRTLGIGSLMAAPIVSGFRVIGLLEVFSPHARGFTKAHGTVLGQLVEMMPKPPREKAPPENAAPEKTQLETPVRPEAVSAVSQPPASRPGLIEFDSIHALREALWEREPELPEQVLQQLPEEIVAEEIPEPVPSSRYRTLIGLVVAVVAMVLGYLAGPIIEKRWADSPQAPQQSAVEAASTVSGQSATDHGAQAYSLGSLHKLADRGDADAQWQMGVRYHNGEGVPRDDVQAMQWFLRAAEQGHVIAQATLGAYYWAGRGVPQDFSKAYFWSAIALAQGDENSKSRLEGLASQMTREQIAAARQQAEAWIQSHNQQAKSGTN